jgi:hypothetical protein
VQPGDLVAAGPRGDRIRALQAETAHIRAVVVVAGGAGYAVRRQPAHLSVGNMLVFTQLSTSWVHDAARWACVDLSGEEAVVMGNLRRFGELPMSEWGTVTSG